MAVEGIAAFRNRGAAMTMNCRALFGLLQVGAGLLAPASNHAEFQILLFRLFEIFLGIVFQILGNSKGFLAVFNDLLQAFVIPS
jgi:hypothetical protein